MTIQLDLNTLIATVVAAILIGFFWRMFNIPDKYMSKKECERRRDGDSKTLVLINTSLSDVHKRVDEIWHHLVPNNGGKG